MERCSPTLCTADGKKVAIPSLNSESRDAFDGKIFPAILRKCIFPLDTPNAFRSASKQKCHETATFALSRPFRSHRWTSCRPARSAASHFSRPINDIAMRPMHRLACVPHPPRFNKCANNRVRYFHNGRSSFPRSSR